MQLTLLLIIVLGFIALIFWGRYTEYALKKKVAEALRRTPCPKCGRNMEKVEVRPIKKPAGRGNVPVPRQPSPGMYSAECPHCGKVWVCEAERGTIRFF
jgi:ssDNA-binding Zn-finger/Zn-ribbon topoisomerase 1